MTPVQLRLVALVVAELAAGWYYLATRPPRYAPPVPDLSTAHPLTAAELPAAAAAARTPDDWAALGSTYLALGYFPEAEACARVAARLAPDSPERAAEWAFALENVSDLDVANATYERAIQLGHPDAGGCSYAIGRNHLRREDTAAARSAFERAGAQPSARYELARLDVRDGNPAAAIPTLDSLATEYPGALQPPLWRHKIELLAGSPRAAVYAERVAHVRGRLPTPFDRDWKRAEEAYGRSGLNGAIKELDGIIKAGRAGEAEPRLAALRGSAWDPRLADLQAEVAFEGRRPGDAVRFLSEAIDRDGPSVHFFTRLGSAYRDSGNPGAAAAAWEHATRLGIGGDTKAAWHELAKYYETTGRGTTAKRAHARAFLGAGHELFWDGKPGDARPAIEEALRYDPDLAPGWFYLGECDWLLGRPAQARASYSRCLDLAPDFGRAHVALALIPR